MLSSPSPFWFIAGATPCAACRGTGLDWHATAGSVGGPRELLACAGAALLLVAVTAAAPMPDIELAEVPALIRRQL